MYVLFVHRRSPETLRLVRISGVPLGIFTQLVLYVKTKMKAINAVFFYILLAIALCSPNVSTYCGNDEQIDDLRTAIIKQESVSTVLTTLSAIPVTGATLAVAQIMISGRFVLHLNELFEEMKSSLNKDHRDYKRCSQIMEMSKAANTVIKPLSYAVSLT